MTTPDEELIAHTRAERERLVDLIGDLTPQQWDIASLCSGWRVREVVAHLSLQYRGRPLRMLTGLVGAGFSFNRYADRDARSTARTQDERDLLAVLRANINHPWTPPGGGPAGALSHDVIHGLDITEPLGLAAAPTDRIAAVLQSTSARQLRYFGVDLSGRRLIADDADVVIGSGPSPVELPAREILLVVTGRRTLDEIGDRERPVH